MYSIRDPDTQQVKVIHRNLLLPVNFLPAGDMSVPVSKCPSLANSELEILVEVQDSETKTAFWLLPTDIADDENLVSQPDLDFVDYQSAEADVGTVTSSPSEDGSVCNGRLNTPSQSAANTDSHTSPNEQVRPCAFGNCGSRPSRRCTATFFLTRAGRRMKHPAHLICDMNKQE